MDPQRQQPPPMGQTPGQPANPLESNPLFQSAFGAAQQAAVNASMQGQDPYQAALQAAHQGVRQAAQPDPNQPGGANLQKITQAIQAKYNLPPDQALLMAHKVAPMLGGGGQQGGQQGTPPAPGGM